MVQDIPSGQDIMVFTETWLGLDATAPDIPGFTAFNHPRKKRAHPPKGGICMYVK